MNWKQTNSHVMHEFEKVTADVGHWARKLLNKLHVFFCHLQCGQVQPSKQRWIVQVTLCTNIRSQSTALRPIS